MKIRPATKKDISQLMVWSRDMFKESRYADDEMDEVSILRNYNDMMESDNGIFLIAEHGFFCGIVVKYWFSTKIAAKDYLFYVVPEHRGDGTAKELLGGYISAARDLGVEYRDIHIGNSTGIATDRVEKFYLNYGFKDIGKNFVLGD